MKKIVIISLSALLALTACVKDVVYPGANFDSLKNTVAFDETSQVTVSVNVSALVDIQEVNLFYTVNNKTEKLAMKNDGKGVYSAVIPAFPMGTKVSYYAEAVTSGGSFLSKVGDYEVGVNPIDYSVFKLNELNGNDKYIEIINTGKEPVNVKGLVIRKDNDKDVWTGPDLEVAAGAYLLLYSEDVVKEGAAHEGYDAALVFFSGLSPKKAVRIQLTDPKGTDVDDFNLVNYTKPAPASYSRVPDGKGDWFYTDATPGAKNPDSASNDDKVSF